MSELKTVIITGANTGIGLAAAKAIFRRGHRIVLACRDVDKADKAKQELSRVNPLGEVHVYPLDLASFDSVRECARRISNDFSRIDVLINNAGVWPSKQSFTAEGFEMQIGVNYLGHFLFTHLLLPRMEAAPGARIIHLSSIMHNLGKIDFDSFRGRKKYHGAAAYGQSKLANVMFSNELARRLPETISSNALHPGGVDSDFYRAMPAVLYRFFRLFLISADRAGKYIADMALSDAWQGQTGSFRAAHGPLPIARRANDPEQCRRLYEESARLTGLNAIPSM